MSTQRKLIYGFAVTLVALAQHPSSLWAQAKSDTSKADAAKATAKADATKSDATKSDAAKAKAKDQLKFEVYQDASKEYRWRLVMGEDKDRQVLATGGQGYKAKADCLNGVKALEERTDKLTFESYEDKGKEYRWRAKATNGQVMASSGSAYKTKAECDKAVDAIKKGAPKATVEEVKEAKS